MGFNSAPILYSYLKLNYQQFFLCTFGPYRFLSALVFIFTSNPYLFPDLHLRKKMLFILFLFALRAIVCSLLSIAYHRKRPHLLRNYSASNQIATNPIGTSPTDNFFYMRSIHVIVYLYIARAYQVRNKKEIQNLSIFQKRNLLRWVYMLLILTCLFQINAILFWANVQDKNSLVIANQFSLWTVLPLFIICIYMFINPFILYGFKQIRYYSTDSVIAKLFNDPLQKVNL